MKKLVSLVILIAQSSAAFAACPYDRPNGWQRVIPDHPDRVVVQTFEDVARTNRSKGDYWFKEKIEAEFNRNFKGRSYFEGKKGVYVLSNQRRETITRPINGNERTEVAMGNVLSNFSFWGALAGPQKADEFVQDTRMSADVYFYPNVTEADYHALQCETLKACLDQAQEAPPYMDRAQFEGFMKNDPDYWKRNYPYYLKAITEHQTELNCPVAN